ncbi:DUF1254 domain-containing protein [Nocardia thailandica]|uniref:DUF1254 domain-containing protein n=1 Tax=Nocardia thailandica TaxID=257275 RepID=A0ABW6PXX1_9NOCA
MHPDYAANLARSAYLWAYPMVNMINRRDRLSAAPEPGRLGGVLPAAPTGQIAMLDDYIDPGQTFIACPNQDVVYGLGYFSLDEQPVVVQVPDFGDRFFVYAFYDARTDQFGRIGSMYGTVAGHYLLAGPGWHGEVPAGIVEVLRSPTTLANAIPRVFMDDTDADRAAIGPLLDQIMVYPLTEFTGQMKTKNWSDVPSFPVEADSTGEETKWVRPETFFDQLPEVLATVPPQPGEQALYAQFTGLLDAAARFPDLRETIEKAVADTDTGLVKGLMRWGYNGSPDRNGWNRSIHNSEWGVDYYNRAATSRSNMFENRPPETQYFYTDHDSDGRELRGESTYRIVFPAGELPPVDGFWSLTLYNEHHFFFPNDLHRYSLGTKNKTLTHGADGSLTLYAGATDPGPDRRSNWLPAPDGPFSLYLRAYGGQAPILDRSWTPPQITRSRH